MSGDAGRDIRERAFSFACRVVQFGMPLARTPGVWCIVDQLLRSGTAVGANLEEAKSASSKREFIRIAEIALREARECHYWLRICRASKLGPNHELRTLEGDADQIVRILTAIVVNTKRRIASN